jgi:release factor glutamine methyltransferase
MTLREALMAAAAHLRAAGIESADLDAALLLAHILRVNRAALYARLADPLPVDVGPALSHAIARRIAGESVAYIVGHKEFYGLDFVVTPAVLVPRPETELLVQWAIDWLRDRVLPARVVDVGTGSGAIAVAVAHTVQTAHVFACDISLKALEIARRNAQGHVRADRVGFICGDLLTWLGQPADLVLANLPYLTDTQMAEPSIAAEPSLALVGGDADGFGLYRRLIPQVGARLMPGGAFAFEIDPAQADIVVVTCHDAFPHATVAVYDDLAGHARFVTVEAALDHLQW